MFILLRAGNKAQFLPPFLLSVVLFFCCSSIFAIPFATFAFVASQQVSWLCCQHWRHGREKDILFLNAPCHQKGARALSPRKAGCNFSCACVLALRFDLCFFVFCLLQPKKKGPANPRSKGAWTKAEDQKVLSRLLLLLEMLESMTCSLFHVFLLQLKKVIEQHGMHGIVANYIQV